MHLHGGSWAHGDKSEVDWRSICQWLAYNGYVGVSVNYRLAPQYPHPVPVEDVLVLGRRLIRSVAAATREGRGRVPER